MQRYIKNKSQLLMIVLIVGFFVGIFYTNILVRERDYEDTIFQRDILVQFVNAEIMTERYSFYVIKERLLLLVSLAIIEMIKYRKVIAVIWLTIAGFIYGTMVSLSISELGGSGILVCVAGGMPQDIFYVMAIGFLFQHWFSEPKRQWNITKMIFVLFMCALGVITEIYVNPLLMKIIINIL